MIFGYARVSTGAQDLTAQLKDLKAAGCERVFKEKISGATADGPQLKKLLALVGEGDVVIIPAVDRLSRDTGYRPRTFKKPERACARLPSLLWTPLPILRNSCLPCLASPRSSNADALRSAQNEAAPMQRQKA